MLKQCNCSKAHAILKARSSSLRKCSYGLHICVGLGNQTTRMQRVNLAALADANKLVHSNLEFFVGCLRLFQNTVNINEPWYPLTLVF